MKNAVRVCRRRAGLGCVLAMLCCLASGVFAHDARPVAVTITQTAPGIYQFSMRVPPSVEADNQPTVVWPSNCVPYRQQDSAVAGMMHCQGELEGQQIFLQYPLYNPSLASFYRLDRLEGGSSTAMLSPTDDKWTVPPPQTPSRVVKEYTLLGIEHILGGYDHLLFVFGLLVIARTPRRILFTVTGFTLAHSITLSLSALGFVHIPVTPVEASIALSIVFLADEIGLRQRGSFTYRYPVVISFCFGLLHGLGFASALGEIGLARNEVVLSLLFFNAGVEVGQLVFIACLLSLVWLGGKVLRLAPLAWHEGKLRARSDLLAAYVIGIPSAYWLIDRVAQFGR